MRGITSKNKGNFYCFHCLHLVRTKNKLESHKQVCQNKIADAVAKLYNDKITNVWRTSPQNSSDAVLNETENIEHDKDVSPELRQKNSDDSRIMWYKNERPKNDIFVR